MKPFLKWPGGKRWLAPALAPVIKSELKGAYFEPFLGAGAVFFELRPDNAILSDVNHRLIQTFRSVKNSPNEVARHLAPLVNTREVYERERQIIRSTAAQRAAQMIFLMRTCWGGVYRVNRNGEFNVPFGNSGRPTTRREDLMEASRILKSAKLIVEDFSTILDRPIAGDVVYIDPPYTTKGENNGFVRYNETLFSWRDQVRLASKCKDLNLRGVTVIISGLFHTSLLALYPGWWAVKIRRPSTISRASHGRREVHEVIILNQPVREEIRRAFKKPPQRIPKSERFLKKWNLLI